MVYPRTATYAALAVALLGQVSAHGTITSVTGANGVSGAGFGILASTPRDGSTPNPFEQDTSVIRDNEINSGKTGACGRTKAGGNNDVTQQLAAASSAGLPTTAADGSLTMNLHQVNQDGAGPYTCEMSTDGGNTFAKTTVSQNVPGFASLSLATAQDFPLVAAAPPTTACAGGPNGDACIMRCRNSALAGPFGSCVAFTNSASSKAGNGTAAAAPAAAAASGAAASGAAATVAPAAAAAATPAAAASGAAGKAGGAGGALGALGGLGGALGGAGGGAGGALGGIAGALGAGGAAGGAGGKAGGLLGKLGGLGRRESQPEPLKRVLNSRIAGAKAGYWI